MINISQKCSDKLFESIEPYRSVYFFGITKNAGKTVALNSAIEGARKKRKRIAVTSIGRDGESFDVFYSDYEKPLIHFEEGEYVITTNILMPSSDFIEVVLPFKEMKTPLGYVVISRVKRPCTIQIAGPSKMSDILELKSHVLEHVDNFFIDGGLDRKAATSYHVSDAIVLSVGASAGNSHVEAINNIGTFSELVFSPRHDDELVEEDNRIEFSGLYHTVEKLSMSPCNCDQSYIYFDGIVTASILDSFYRRKYFSNFSFVANQFSDVFIDYKSWRLFKDRGLKLFLKHNLNVAAITVNPSAPNYENVDSKIFFKEVSRIYRGTPVFDVMAELESVN